jgi:mono/diheme cytochrome c family protein
MLMMISACTFVVFVCFQGATSGQTKDRNERGRKLYVQYCASCHGMDAKGSGPVAPALKVAPTDLTTIAQRNGGKFSAQDVQLHINGENDIPAHGSKDMPVWGAYFRSSRGQGVATLNIYNLTKYLEAIQVK